MLESLSQLVEIGVATYESLDQGWDTPRPLVVQEIRAEGHPSNNCVPYQYMIKEVIDLNGTHEGRRRSRDSCTLS